MLNWPKEIFRMKKNLRMPRDELDRMRIELLKSQLLDAYENIPFYRTAFKRNGLDPNKFNRINDILDYPVITRAEIQKDDSKFQSIKIDSGKVKRSHSSGSTGRPLWVNFDSNTWIRKKYLSKLRSRMECGMKLGEKAAIFDTDPPEKLAQRNQSVLFSTPLLKAKFFSIFNSSEIQVAELLQWSPQNIDSPPSHLFQLAIDMERGQIRPDSVQRIFTSSEYLEPNMRRYIQGRYAAEVFDIYGCTEVKEIAWECDRHNGYHINEDEVYVEILNGQVPAKPGEVADIVLTDLRNKAMPLIRYRIGDRGMLLPGRCSCGRVFSRMAPVAGRSSDFIITPSGLKLSPYRFTTVLEKVSGLMQYQLVQEDGQSIIVKAVMDIPPNARMLQEIQKKMHAIVVEPMEIRIGFYDKIDIEENGKFKVVKSGVGINKNVLK